MMVSLTVNYGGVAVKDSPFRVYASIPLDPTKVRCYGPWLDNEIKPGETTHFTVDAR